MTAQGRYVVPTFIIMVVAIGVFAFVAHHFGQLKQAQQNANDLTNVLPDPNSQEWKDYKTIGEIKSDCVAQLETYRLGLLNVSANSQEVLAQEQLERQYIQEWFAAKKQEQLSKGADSWVIQQLVLTMHETELEAIQDANNLITNQASGSGVSQ